MTDRYEPERQEWSDSRVQQQAIRDADERFDRAQRAADAAYDAGDRSPEAGREWSAAIRSAQDAVRAERDADVEAHRTARSTRSQRNGPSRQADPDVEAG